MSDQNTRKEKLKIIFATYPQEDTVYMTSDDKAFFNEPQAEAHAQRLKDQNVSKYPKKFWEQAIDILDKNQESNLENQEAADKKQEEAGAEGDEVQEGADEADEEAAKEEDERAALAARFEELSGKKPAWNMKLEKLQEAVKQLEENANN